MKERVGEEEDAWQQYRNNDVSIKPAIQFTVKKEEKVLRRWFHHLYKPDNEWHQ